MHQKVHGVTAWCACVVYQIGLNGEGIVVGAAATTVQHDTIIFLKFQYNQ